MDHLVPVPWPPLGLEPGKHRLLLASKRLGLSEPSLVWRGLEQITWSPWAQLQDYEWVGGSAGSRRGEGVRGSHGIGTRVLFSEGEGVEVCVVGGLWVLGV